jgi:hypothetical protein
VANWLCRVESEMKHTISFSISYYKSISLRRNRIYRFWVPDTELYSSNLYDFFFLGLYSKVEILMPSNPRPGENPADIVDGTRKRKASERSTFTSDVVDHKKTKVTTATAATAKKGPVTKNATAIVTKSTEFLKKAFMKKNKLKPGKSFVPQLRKHTYWMSLVTSQPADTASMATTSRSSTASSRRRSVEALVAKSADFLKKTFTKPTKNKSRK